MFKNFNQEEGLSLIEAVVATVIVSIGLISIFALANTTTKALINSVERDKATLLSSMILEDFEMNISNLTPTNYHNKNLKNACNLSSNSSYKHERHLKKWCEKFNQFKGGLGNSSTQDQRLIKVREKVINGKTIKIVTIQIKTADGKITKVLKKIINAKD